MMHPEYVEAIAEAHRADRQSLADRIEGFGLLTCRWCRRPWHHHPLGQTGPRCPDGGPLAFDRAGAERWATDGGR